MSSRTVTRSPTSTSPSCAGSTNAASRRLLMAPASPTRAPTSMGLRPHLRLDQAAADRVAGQLDAVAHPQLVEDVLTVSLHRLHADHELLGDLLRRVRLGDQLQHLELARRQDLEVVVPALDDVLDEARDRRGVEERLAAHRPPHRLDDVVVGVRLEHVPRGAGLERLEQELLAVVHRQHQEAKLRLALAELLRRLDARRLPHGHVEDCQVDVAGERLLDRLGAVLGLGDDLEVGLGVEHLLQTGADDRMVVGDEDPGDERDRHQALPAGTSSRTSTPPSRPRFTASAPPTSTARSRIPRMPPYPFATAASSRPRPSSTTRRTTLPAPGSSATSTREACACRATFVRLSCATR